MGRYRPDAAEGALQILKRDVKDGIYLLDLHHQFVAGAIAK